MSYFEDRVGLPRTIEWLGGRGLGFIAGLLAVVAVSLAAPVCILIVVIGVAGELLHRAEGEE